MESYPLNNAEQHELPLMVEKRHEVTLEGEGSESAKSWGREDKHDQNSLEEILKGLMIIITLSYYYYY